jgi:hypothetical protein
VIGIDEQAELAAGMLRSILRQAGWSVETPVSLLK